MSPLLATTELPQALNVPLNPFWIGVIAIGLIVVGVSGAIGAINGFLTLVARFKQTPPLHEKYATKVEMSEADKSVLTKLNEVESRLKQDLKEKISNISLEGRNRETRLHEHIASTAVKDSAIQTQLNGIANQLGELFGILEGKGVIKK